MEQEMSVGQAVELLDKSCVGKERKALEVIKKELDNDKIHLTELVECFETTQCYVSVFKTDKQYLGEKIYVLTSIRKNNDKILIRFGNEVQIACIKNTYRIVNQRPEYTKNS